MKKGFLFFAVLSALLLLASCPMEVDTTTGGGGDNLGITWADPAFGVAARVALEKAVGASVTPTEATTITELDLSGKSISKLDDIKYFTGLTTLNLSDTDSKIEDFPTDLVLANLTDLDLSSNKIQDISGLPSIAPNLTKLNLESNKITTISALSTLAPKLTDLDLSDNSIENISALSTLAPKLTDLDLSDNSIENISALATLNANATVDLRENTINSYFWLKDNVADWEPIDHVTNVTGRPEIITWKDDAIEAAARVALGTTDTNMFTNDVEEIKELNISGKIITNLDDIKYFTGLTSLNLSDTGISDISVLSDLTRLTTLNLSDNDIVEISVLSALVSRLDTLDLSNNQIIDIGALSNLDISAILDLSDNTAITTGDWEDWHPVDHVTTVTGRPSYITWVDTTFEEAIRDHLERTAEGHVFVSEVDSITNLDFSNKRIRTLDDIVHFTGLTNLNLSSNNINNISKLSGLKIETILDLRNNPSIIIWTPVDHVTKVKGRPTEPKLEENTYKIATPEELLWIAAKSGDFSGKTVEFTVDIIDMEYQLFSGIKTFAGTMTGKTTGTTITNLKIESDEDSVGFIGELKGGTIQNLIMDDTCTIQGDKVVGSFVGRASSKNSVNPTIQNLRNEAAVMVTGNKSYKKAGGIIGYGSSARIQNVHNFGAVTVDNGFGMEVGGIIGNANNCIIAYAQNIGTITGSSNGSNLGGIVGVAEGAETQIQRAMNFGNITGSGSGTNVGGIIGEAGAIIGILDAANVGTITGNSTDAGDASTGGIIGANDGANMFFVYNYGDFSGGWAGSLVGLLTKTVAITAYVKVPDGDGATVIPVGASPVDGSVTVPNTIGGLTAERFKEDTLFTKWKNWEIKTNALYPTLKPLVP